MVGVERESPKAMCVGDEKVTCGNQLGCEWSAFTLKQKNVVLRSKGSSSCPHAAKYPLFIGDL